MVATLRIWKRKMKIILMATVILLSACSTTPQQRLLNQCEEVRAEALRTQMGCKQDTDVRAQLYQQCQVSCNGGVDRDTIDRCLTRCDDFLERQKQK
jgi:hypothetical protein